MKNLKSTEFWAAILIVIATIGLMVADYLRVFHFGFFVGPLRANHWFVFFGTSYVALAVPIIAVLKKRYPGWYLDLFRVHIFGNLLAFLFYLSPFFRPNWQTSNILSNIRNWTGFISNSAFDCLKWFSPEISVD